MHPRPRMWQRTVLLGKVCVDAVAILRMSPPRADVRSVPPQHRLRLRPVLGLALREALPVVPL